MRYAAARPVATLFTLDDTANIVDGQRTSSYWMRTHNIRPLLYTNPLIAAPSYRALGSVAK